MSGKNNAIIFFFPSAGSRSHVIPYFYFLHLSSSQQKPHYRSSRNHVNQVGPASSVPRCLPLAKQRSLPFCCLWGGVLRRLRAVIQQRMQLSAPHTEKANSPQGIDGIGREG